MLPTLSSAAASSASSAGGSSSDGGSSTAGADAAANAWVRARPSAAPGTGVPLHARALAKQLGAIGALPSCSLPAVGDTAALAAASAPPAPPAVAPVAPPAPLPPPGLGQQQQQQPGAAVAPAADPQLLITAAALLAQYQQQLQAQAQAQQAQLHAGCAGSPTFAAGLASPTNATASALPAADALPMPSSAPPPLPPLALNAALQPALPAGGGGGLLAAATLGAGAQLEPSVLIALLASLFTSPVNAPPACGGGAAVALPPPAADNCLAAALAGLGLGATSGDKVPGGF